MIEKINFFTNNQGLTVVHIPKNDSANISISLRVIAGSMYENKEEIGVAHFLEHIVLDGTKKYPNKKLLSGIIDERGGTRNASTNKETIEYTIKMMKEDVEIAFDFLSQITIYPLISENDINKEKKIIEQEINRIKSDPEKFSQRLIYSGLYPEIRLGALNTGDIDDIRNLKKEIIVSYHKRTHCAKNMVLSVCGNISQIEIRKLVDKYFKDLDGGTKISPIPVNVNQLREKIIKNLPNLKQSILTIGYNGISANEDEKYAMDLISKILMTGSTSRLRYEVREKKALAYAINGINSHGRNHGIFTIQVGLDKNNIKECLDSIKNELNKLKTDLIDVDELNKAFIFIKSGQSFNFEDSLFLASFYSDMWCSTGTVFTINDILSKYKYYSTNPSIIKETAIKVFGQKPSILILGSDITDDIAFL